jgi:predicted O-methyltransferase YrrM
MNTAPDSNHVRQLLTHVYGHRAGTTEAAFTKKGMSVNELVELHRLARTPGVTEILEIGMAAGTSSVVFCDAVANAGGRVTSVDPFQSHKDHSAGSGIKAVAAAGHAARHKLIEQPDYLALPQLLVEGRTFDLIFIDGWHSFDYTLLDLFYADLLLRDSGILACHDATSPPVYKAVRFLELNKPYSRISPPVMVELPSLSARAWRRLRIATAGREVRDAARARRERWRTLAAYRKTASRQCPESVRDF